jgi:hypothetical protein
VSSAPAQLRTIWPPCGGRLDRCDSERWMFIMVSLHHKFDCSSLVSAPRVMCACSRASGAAKRGHNCHGASFDRMCPYPPYARCVLPCQVSLVMFFLLFAFTEVRHFGRNTRLLQGELMRELFECVFGKLHRMDYAKLFAFSLLRTPF